MREDQDRSSSIQAVVVWRLVLEQVSCLQRSRRKERDSAMKVVGLLSEILVLPGK